MYHKAKYIVGEIQGTFMASMCAVTFPETIGHDEAAKVFVPGTIRSAGFFHYDDEKVWAYGESVSLRIKSDPDRDEQFIGRAISHSQYVLL